jgi:hypothetical protein
VQSFFNISNDDFIFISPCGRRCHFCLACHVNRRPYCSHPAHSIFKTSPWVTRLWQVSILACTSMLRTGSIKGFDDIVDMELNVRFLNDVANVMGMYRTLGSMIAGVGINLHKAVAVQVMYNIQTGGVKTNVDNVFELGLTAHLAEGCPKAAPLGTAPTIGQDRSQRLRGLPNKNLWHSCNFSSPHRPIINQKVYTF